MPRLTLKQQFLFELEEAIKVYFILLMMNERVGRIEEVVTDDNLALMIELYIHGLSKRYIFREMGYRK